MSTSAVQHRHCPLPNSFLSRCRLEHGALRHRRRSPAMSYSPACTLTSCTSLAAPTAVCPPAGQRRRSPCRGLVCSSFLGVPPPPIAATACPPHDCGADSFVPLRLTWILTKHLPATSLSRQVLVNSTLVVGILRVVLVAYDVHPRGRSPIVVVRPILDQVARVRVLSLLLVLPGPPRLWPIVALRGRAAGHACLRPLLTLQPYLLMHLASVPAPGQQVAESVKLPACGPVGSCLPPAALDPPPVATICARLPAIAPQDGWLPGSGQRCGGGRRRGCAGVCRLQDRRGRTGLTGTASITQTEDAMA